jgi:hypothetical protein
MPPFLILVSFSLLNIFSDFHLKLKITLQEWRDSPRVEGLSKSGGTLQEWRDSPKVEGLSKSGGILQEWGDSPKVEGLSKSGGSLL